MSSVRERLEIEPETDNLQESVHSFLPTLLIGSGIMLLNAQVGGLWPE